MATYLSTTELEAVNDMLMSIGESPINQLGVSGLSDAGIAEQILHNTNRSVQAKGWYFNREYEYPLAPDVNNEVLVPTNTLHVDSSRVNGYIDVVHRGTKLYDRDNKTYTFSQTYKYDLILFLPFTDIPEAARTYISIKAARAFQRRVLGSDALNTISREEEQEAMVTLLEAEGDAEDANILTGSYSTQGIVNRRYNP